MKRKNGKFAPYNEKPSFFARNWHWIITIPFVLFAVSFFAIERCDEWKEQRDELQQKQVEEAQDHMIRDWKPIEVAPLLKEELGLSPKIPPVPTTHNSDELLKYLLENHPESVIKNDLDKKIESYEILWAFNQDETQAASFIVSPRELLTGNKLPDNRKEFPILLISEYSLQSMNTTDDALRVMAILYHEYRHYIQWLEGDEVRRGLSHPVTHIQSTSQVQCEALWDTEREAHQDQCKLLIRWGKPELEGGGLCYLIHNDAAFNQTLFFIMYNFGMSQKMPECLPIWAKKAGHPHADKL